MKVAVPPAPSQTADARLPAPGTVSRPYAIYNVYDRHRPAERLFVALMASDVEIARSALDVLPPGYQWERWTLGELARLLEAEAYDRPYRRPARLIENLDSELTAALRWVLQVPVEALWAIRPIENVAAVMVHGEVAFARDTCAA